MWPIHKGEETITFSTSTKVICDHAYTGIIKSFTAAVLWDDEDVRANSLPLIPFSDLRISANGGGAATLKVNETVYGGEDNSRRGEVVEIHANVNWDGSRTGSISIEKLSIHNNNAETSRPCRKKAKTDKYHPK